jgi:enediyne biosynthesis protein E3
MFTIKQFPASGITVNRPLTRLRKHVLGISFQEVTFERRGFIDGEREARARLEQIGRVFLQGYHAALNDEGPDTLAFNLEAIDRELSGFAYEGAAMGLTLLDQLSFSNRRRLDTFLNVFGPKHSYMIHVGVGWAIARVPWLRRNFEQAVDHLDPLLRWLAADGNGFSDFYFGFPNFLRKPERLNQRLNRLHGYTRHAYAQGVGRSLWFVAGTNANRISAWISLLPHSLHGDLWSGAGLACAMAGGADRGAIERLKSLSGDHQAAVAQGAAFAAKTRQQADNPTHHTEMACQILCGLNADAAAQLTDATRRCLPEDGKVPAYEIWRQRIQSQFPWS